VTCPVCGGPISRGAAMCARCRRSAIAVGVKLLVSGQAPPRPAVEDPPSSARQQVAIGVKCSVIDKARGAKAGTRKRELLAAAGIASTKELTFVAASDLLDELKAEEEAWADGTSRAADGRVPETDAAAQASHTASW
jgi:hypothetical protein